MLGLIYITGILAFELFEGGFNSDKFIWYIEKEFEVY